MRKLYGAFKSVDDLRAIKGIGLKRLEKMRKISDCCKAPGEKTSEPAKSTGKTKTPTSPGKSQPDESSSPE